MSSLGELPRFDFAIFSDPGKEKTSTYSYLKYLLHWQKNNDGIEIIIVNNKNLYSDLLSHTNSTKQHFAPIPAFTKNNDGTIGMLRRQCTHEYKIAPIDRAIRYYIYGSQARKHLPNTRIWKGISRDEIDRMSIPQEAWKHHIYPFCGWETFSPGKAIQLTTADSMLMFRDQITSWYHKKGFPVPLKSSCVFCPFQSDGSWFHMKTFEPADFKAACTVDASIRNSTKQRVKMPIYLHKSCIPLSDVHFKAQSPDLWSGDCSGTCHI